MKVCVFGSSHKNTSKDFIEQSKRLGKLIARKNLICVNGAGQFGCMGTKY